MQLRILDHLPEGLLEQPASALLDRLGGPTLFRLSGRRPQALFASVLLHGNEVTGWDALRRLLRDYQPGGGQQKLPRSLLLFVGNVQAAAAGVRRLDHQPDYNRIWPGGDAPDSPERQLIAQLYQLLSEIAEAGELFASVDVHNNTGRNPHYACINRLTPEFLHLGRMFSRTLVYFTRPRGVQSLALSQLCPSVTLECGKPDQPHGAAHAREFVEACLHLSRHPNHPPVEQDLDLYHTVARVRVAEDLAFGFDPDCVPLTLPNTLEDWNFRELAVGTVLANYRGDQRRPLEVEAEDGGDCFDRFLQLDQQQLLLRRPVMPSMLTSNLRVIRQDCLCYLMERLPLAPTTDHDPGPS